MAISSIFFSDSNQLLEYQNLSIMVTYMVMYNLNLRKNNNESHSIFKNIQGNKITKINFSNISRIIF